MAEGEKARKEIETGAKEKGWPHKQANLKKSKLGRGG